MSEGSDKVIHVYPTSPAFQGLDKVKTVQTKFFKINRMNQSILEKIFNKITRIDGMKGQSHGSQLRETFEKLTQQLNHEIDLCKKDPQKQLQKKWKVDLLFKTFCLCLWKMRGQLYDPIEAGFVIFLLCLK